MSAFQSIVLFTCFVLSHCVTIHRNDKVDIISKNREELPALHILAVLNDMIVISAPVVQNARYYIFKPNGDAIKLNISRPSYPPSDRNLIDNNYDSILITYTNHSKGILPVSDFKVFNLFSKYIEESNQTFEQFADKMNANDFIIGPLDEEDNGNWVLSTYSKDENGDWNEMFRVITIDIREYIPPKPRIAKLREGETFEFSFAHPIPHISSCELKAPRSTFDRFYERDHINMASCGYLIPNVTKQDQGTWKITAVGRISYGTLLYLEVTNETSILT